MTVCVASIYNSGWGLVACSDRMLSASSQYESPEAKIYRFTSSIVAMFSGEDVSFQRGIHDRVKAIVDARVRADQSKWLTVNEVANLYQRCYNDVRRHMAEQAILAPFDLDYSEFLRIGATMNRRLAEQLALELKSFRVPRISALIIGMDQSGNSPISNAHIYKFENWDGRDSDISCEDAIGFAAIGSGGFHAESQLMRAAYGPSQDEPTALLTTFLAKKRGEAAPGVGALTDTILWVHRPPDPGFVDSLIDVASHELESAWKRVVKSESRALGTSLTKVAAFVATRRKPQAPAGQVSSMRAQSDGPATAPRFGKIAPEGGGG